MFHHHETNAKKRGNRVRAFLAVSTLVMTVYAGPLVAQDVASDSSTASSEIAEENLTKVVLDDAPILSPRAAAMGGAIATMADDMDATWFNPAGIGGLHWGTTKLPAVRKLYFPSFGIAANSNVKEFNRDFRSEGAGKDADIGASLLDAHAGKRQYARTAATLGVVTSRIILLPYYDQQFAAVGQGNDTGRIDAKYRSMSGIGLGSSIAGPEESFYFGYHANYATVSEVTGEFQYQDIARKESRSQVIADNTQRYSGIAHTAGFIANVGKAASPKVAVVMRNVQGASFEAAKAAVEPLEFQEDLTVAFSVSPKLGRLGTVNWALEAGRLTDADVAMKKKLRTGLEFEYGEYRGSYTLFALRAGYNHAGSSFGLALNLGILAFDVASHAEDLGVGNNRVIERRNTASLSVNVAEF